MSIGTTAVSVLVPLVFTTPVLSSTVTIHSSSTLSVNAASTSGGFDSVNVREDLTGSSFPDPIATSRADAVYSVNTSSGIHNYPFYSVADYNFGGSIMRTDFSHRVVTSYPEYAGQHQSYAQTTGEVVFTVGPLGTIAEISGRYTPPTFREGDPGDVNGAGTFESEFFVEIYNMLDLDNPVFSFDQLNDGNSFFSPLTFDVGQTYVYRYSALSKIVDGENTYYDADGFLQLEFLTAGGPTPIPLPAAGLGGMALMGLAGLRRRKR